MKSTRLSGHHFFVILVISREAEIRDFNLDIISIAVYWLN